MHENLVAYFADNIAKTFLKINENKITVERNIPIVWDEYPFKILTIIAGRLLMAFSSTKKDNDKGKSAKLTLSKNPDNINIIKKVKAERKKIVFTNGCFDLLHVGHIRYLAQAKKLGNFLIIGLNSDSSVKELKGEDRPINSFEDRATLLSAIKSVDLVIMFEEQTPENLIKDIVPDILVKGGDYNIEDIVGYQTVIQNGGQVKTLSFYDGYSSTNYINKIKKH